MAGTDSIVGSGYEIPQFYYLKKIEQTCIFEDPDQINTYFRKELKDLKPDKPFFESDQTRYNNYSSDRLNLRHGGRRTLNEPYLPDGTFLDFSFVEKDPRGNAVEPDMRNYKKQHQSRTRFIKFFPDNDDSINESYVHPTQMQMQIKNEFYNTKNRMNVFDTSLESRHNGGTYNKGLTSTGICLQEIDEKNISMRDEACSNNTRKTTDLSNDTSIGWRRTTDHRFTVAKYGQSRGTALLSDQDWNKNRGSSRIEHDILVSYQDQNIPKSLVLKMADIARQRKNEIKSGKTMQFASSQQQLNSSRRITTDDIGDFNYNSTTQTRSSDPHTLLNGEQISHRSGKDYIPKYDPNIFDKIILDPTIFDNMIRINNKMAPREMDDLRNQIEQSNENKLLLIHQKNKQVNMNINNNESLWQVETNYEKGKSKKLVNYSKTNSNTYINKPFDAENINYEDYKNKSFCSAQRRGNIKMSNFHDPDTQYDNDYGKEISRSHLVGPLGSKFTRDYIERETSTIDQNNLKEISAIN
jgi:hypothetical protein